MSTKSRVGLLVFAAALVVPIVLLIQHHHPLRAFPLAIGAVLLAGFAILWGRLEAPLIAVPAIVLTALIFTLAVNWKPELGLDLQGGVSVVLKPVAEAGSNVDVSEEALDETKAIIERRVNALGIGEPDITRQGKTIVVQIPGIKDQQRALDLVGQTAELRFRPVLTQPVAAPSASDLAEIPVLRASLKIPDGIAAVTVINDELTKRGKGPAELLPGDPSTTTTSTTTPPTTVDPNAAVPPTAPAADPNGAVISPTPTSGTGAGTGGGSSGARAASARTAAQEPATTVTPATSTPSETSTTSTTSTTTTTIDPAPVNAFGIQVFENDTGLTLEPDLLKLYQLETARDEGSKALTSLADDKKDQAVTLAGREQTDKKGNKTTLRYSLGPSLLEGQSVETASAGLGTNGQWEVRPVFRDGPDGIDKFNAAAAICNSGAAQCPTRQLAIVLDGEVISAPTIQNPTFARDQIQISGSFTEAEAKDLALALRYGSLPIQLAPQQVETVSATLGKGALRAGLIAGGLGLGVVILYMIFYYRLLGAVAIASLFFSASTLWVIISLLGEESGLTLSLSGIVGIIVSIGVSLDTNIVYFENLKEDVHNGRTLRSSAERSFQSAFGTMLKANLSSLIGAVILYLITVGPVKGFAFYLGLSTILDLLFAFTFMYPAVRFLVKGKLGLSPHLFGIPTPEEFSSNLADPKGTGGAANEPRYGVPAEGGAT